MSNVVGHPFVRSDYIVIVFTDVTILNILLPFCNNINLYWGQEKSQLCLLIYVWMGLNGFYFYFCLNFYFNSVWGARSFLLHG